MKNRSEVVHEILMDCLYRKEEVNGGQTPADAIIVQGVTMKIGLHPGRVKQHDADIAAVLEGLPPQFYEGSGGGWSFLNLCNDAEGHQWGEHMNMQELCFLAIASGKGEWSAPRELWDVLPGGMPYVMFNPKGLRAQEAKPVEEEK